MINGKSAQGRWAKGPSIDGKGEFQYVANPQPIEPEPQPPQPDPKLYATPQNPQVQDNGASAPPRVKVERIG